jgi:CBS domain-containing protein
MLETKMTETPGGAQPQIIAETIMTAKVHCITPEMTISQAIGVLLSHRIRGAPVVDTLTKVISEITEADLMKLAATKGLNKTIATCLDSLPTFDSLITFKRTTPFSTLYREFLTHPVHRIVIVDNNGRLQGLISRSDILRLLYRPNEEVPSAKS